MNYQEILSKGSKILKVNNIKSFNLDSEILLSSIVGLKRERLLLNLEKEIDEAFQLAESAPFPSEADLSLGVYTDTKELIYAS